MKYLIVLCLIACSCASVKKTADTRHTETRQADNSVTNSGYTRETTITEKSTAPTLLPGNNIQASGFVPIGDTGKIVSESDDMTITTTSVPVKDSSGKTIGNKINTKATTKPKRVAVLVDKQTQTKESGTKEEKRDIITTIKTDNKNTAKSTWRLSTSVQIVIGLVIITALLFGLYKLWRR